MGKSKLKRLKKLSDLITEYNGELLNEILKIKKEHQKVLLESNTNLISEICKGEGLDEIAIKEKYLKSSKKKKLVEKVEETPDDEQLLCHMKLEGSDYFYEDKMNGNVYDSKNKKVGVYSCGNIIFK
tara:strand:+ start:157 stop:537 length:381 start_codon:yes stop_codon:yes gene_type:complete